MEHPFPETWWKHRRRLAYVAMAGLFALILAVMLMPEGQVVAATPVMTAVAWMFGAVLLAYVAAAAAEDLVKIRSAR